MAALRQNDLRVAREIRTVLDEFEGLLRQVNPVIASRLLPGITGEELARLEKKYDVEIPEEAAAVWRWHNGLLDTGEPGCQNLVTRNQDFLSLDESLAAGRKRVEVPVAMYAETGFTHIFEGRTLVALLAANVGPVIDISPGKRLLTYVLAPETLDMNELSVMPLVERVQWWSTALRSGAWYADENGSWHAGSDDNFPDYPYENAF